MLEAIPQVPGKILNSYFSLIFVYVLFELMGDLSIWPLRERFETYRVVLAQFCYIYEYMHCNDCMFVSHKTFIASPRLLLEQVALNPAGF